MVELNYAKKRLEPIIMKYGIDTENDKVFKSIIILFNGQTDYQMWALKLVFGKQASLDTVIEIKEWADNNPTDIQSLSKQNLVSYKTIHEIRALLEEMMNIDAFHVVKNVISLFNTEQKHILKQYALDVVKTPYNALSNTAFQKFYKLAKDFNKLPANRKQKFVILMSAVHDLGTIMSQMKSALEQSYTWDREDLLSYVDRNNLNAEVVYDQNNIVILRISDFETSKKLCGGGRTAWCLTRENSYFQNYTSKQDNSQQFFLFDFNLKEDNELAHVGFSVHPRRGIINAHTTRNFSIVKDYEINNERWNIHKLLQHHNIDKSTYIRLKKLTNYSWDKLNFVERLTRAHNTAKSFELEDGRLVVEIANSNIHSFVFGHTLLGGNSNTTANDSNKVFAVLDFSKDLNSDKSVIAIVFSKDIYGTLSPNAVHDPYGAMFTDAGILSKYNLTSDVFVKSNNIEPQILLHKLIDEKNIQAAIKLLEENPELDPNTMFYNNLPIVKALMQGSKPLFDALVNHKNFDMNLTEGFGEPYAQFLLLFMQSEYSKNNKGKMDVYIDMCLSLLQNPKYNCNCEDINNDTVLHLACESTITLPIVAYLISRGDVQINSTNDWGYAPIDVAIENNNTEAIKMLLSRPDIEINNVTRELAQSVNISLDNLMSQVGKTDVTSASEPSQSNDYADIFARAFGN